MATFEQRVACMRDKTRTHRCGASRQVGACVASTGTRVSECAGVSKADAMRCVWLCVYAAGPLALYSAVAIC